MSSPATGPQPRTFQACTIRAVLLCHRDAVVQRIHACVTASVGVALVAEDAHADAALASAHQLGADVLILDLDPRHPDDLRAVRRLAPPLRPRLLLVSSEHEDAVLAFDLGAVDFLTAPVEVARFRQAMARVRSAVALDRLRAYHEDSLARLRDVFTLFEDEVTEREASSSDGATLIELRTGGRTVTLAATTIRWISVDKNDVTVHHDAGTVTARHTLADLVARLDPTRFVRTHRSAVVNVDCVRELRRAPPRRAATRSSARRPVHRPCASRRASFPRAERSRRR